MIWVKQSSAAFLPGCKTLLIPAHRLPVMLFVFVI